MESVDRINSDNGTEKKDKKNTVEKENPLTNRQKITIFTVLSIFISEFVAKCFFNASITTGSIMKAISINLKYNMQYFGMYLVNLCNIFISKLNIQKGIYGIGNIMISFFSIMFSPYYIFKGMYDIIMYDPVNTLISVISTYIIVVFMLLVLEGNIDRLWA